MTGSGVGPVTAALGVIQEQPADAPAFNGTPARPNDGTHDGARPSGWRWWWEARCTGEPLSVFYPPIDARADALRRARWFCGQCPVITECLESALAEESRFWTEPHGFRGGLTAGERSKLIKKRPEIL